MSILQKQLRIVVNVIFLSVCTSVVTSATETVPLATFRSSLEQLCTMACENWSGMQWVDKRQPDLAKPYETCFTQKIDIPQGSHLIVWGDLHGNYNVLMLMIQRWIEEGVLDAQWRIQTENTFLIGLGDYVDRGTRGIAVISALARLMAANPGTMFLLRGNHEDLQLNKEFGFLEELHAAYGSASASLIPLIARWYATLPVALYIGVPQAGSATRYVLCCHGGLEFGYHPDRLMRVSAALVGEVITELVRSKTFESLALLPEGKLQHSDKVRDLKAGKVNPAVCGFLWNDFSTEDIFLCQGGRGLLCGQRVTQTLLAHESESGLYELVGIIRAHQHSKTLCELPAHQGAHVLAWKYPVLTTVAIPLRSTYACSFVKLALAPPCGRIWEAEHMVYAQGTGKALGVGSSWRSCAL